MDAYECLQESVRVIRRHRDSVPDVALILGSGLGALAGEVEDATSVSYADLPHFPKSTAPGHAGRLVLGSFEGRFVAMMAGRAHMYEGYSAQEVSFPVRALRMLGARVLIITNAAGGINESYSSGALMLITDHINLTGCNPLIGPNDQRLGPRFPDMTEAYSPRLKEVARNAAEITKVPLVEGVYLGLLGPNYETPAEIRMARKMGADAVGMSTVMEVLVANHAGMEVLGISCITNMAAGILPQKLDEQEVIETAQRVQTQFASLLRGVVRQL